MIVHRDLNISPFSTLDGLFPSADLSASKSTEVVDGGFLKAQYAKRDTEWLAVVVKDANDKDEFW